MQNLKHSADVADYRGQKYCWCQCLFNCSLANPYLPYYSITHEAIVPSFRILLMPLNTSFSLHMKCRDAIGVMVVTRWRRQAYLMWLKTRVKNEKIFMSIYCYSSTVYFDWFVIPHTPFANIRKFTTSHCYNFYTSNMAEVTIVDRMTQLSSGEFD